MALNQSLLLLLVQLAALVVCVNALKHISVGGTTFQEQEGTTCPMCSTVFRDGTPGSAPSRSLPNLALSYVIRELDASGAECCAGSTCTASCKGHRLGGEAGLSWNLVDRSPDLTVVGGNALVIGGHGTNGAGSCTPPGAQGSICPVLKFTSTAKSAADTLSLSTNSTPFFTFSANSFLVEIEISRWLFAPGSSGLRVIVFAELQGQSISGVIAESDNAFRFNVQSLDLPDAVIKFAPQVVLGSGAAPVNVSVHDSVTNNRNERRFFIDLAPTADATIAKVVFNVRILTVEESLAADTVAPVLHRSDSVVLIASALVLFAAKVFVR